MPAIEDTIPDDLTGQDPTGPDSDPPGSQPNPANTFPYKNLDEAPPGSLGMTNAKIFSTGAMAISHLLVGWPPRDELPDADLVTAGRELWRLHIMLSTAKTKREFIELMTFLMRD